MPRSRRVFFTRHRHWDTTRRRARRILSAGHVGDGLPSGADNCAAARADTSVLEGLHTDTRAAQPASSVDSTLNPAATHPGCHGGGYHRSLGDRRAAPGCHGGGYDRGLGDRRADDADSSDTCWPKWHCQSPTVAVTRSASIEAMIAWMGIRPLAISWPPECRTADAKGAAHKFSRKSTPAVLPG